MSLSPSSGTAAIAMLKQVSDAELDPNDEAYFDRSMLAKLSQAYGESWVTDPTQILEEDQLQKLFRIIVMSPKAGDYHKEWKDQVKNENALARAQVTEPTIKKCLQECWATTNFSVIRHAGQ